MNMNSQNISRVNLSVIFIFFLCFLYWIYLFFTTEMSIQFDAASYESLGRMIHEQGWAEFLRNGPTREPLYPLTIALSMDIAQFFSINYQWAQKIFQIIILFVTQLLMLVLLGKLKIHEGIKLLTILYFGFSPAIINSTFSLYSEIATYPFVLAAVLLGYYSWRAVHCDSLKRVVLFSGLTALSFVGASFAKGIFQYVFLCFLAPFMVVTIQAMIRNNRTLVVRGIVYLVVAVFVMNSFVISYRFLNKRFNGHFEFTSRYDTHLLGTASMRVNKLSPRLLMAHMVSIPGTGVCRKFFDAQTCQSCEHPTMYAESVKLSSPFQSHSADQAHTKIIFLAFKKIGENPPQYFFLTAVESLKMAFWESTQIGSVVYPDRLRRFFNFSLVKNSIRLIAALLTYIALFFLLRRVYKHRAKLRIFEANDHEDIQLGFFILLIISSFTGLYALFPILTRFSFPIAALYLISIAYGAQKMKERVGQ